MDAEHRHIGDVAEETSLSLRTLRHYDEIGLIVPSARTEGGFRLYTDADVARIMVVRRMKPLGYSLEEMRDVLAVLDRLAEDAADDGARTRLDEIRTEATERKSQLEAKVAMADEFLTQLASS
ncbi:MerR family transcriptional regulator [Microbacterium sp. NPDC077184]|uniref:MerR family transcriptional regulator n=1 Tax=Microbacterium sp. NPDC077184 TaxID=3154764 RepID=UPI00344332B1